MEFVGLGRDTEVCLSPPLLESMAEVVAVVAMAVVGEGCEKELGPLISSEREKIMEFVGLGTGSGV